MTDNHGEKLHTKEKHKISSEMYLKTIFLLKEKNNKDPRPIDTANELEIAKGSVSEMLKKLAEEGDIEYESYGRIKLTEKGFEKAKNVVRKYMVVKKFLSDVLRIEPSKVHAEACNLEHAFSDESIAKLNILMKIMDKDIKERSSSKL